MERTWRQKDLGEAWFSPKLGRNARLEKIAQVFDWDAIEAIAPPLYAGRVGRPAWPSLMIQKALLLAAWYGLSDAALEEALCDRLSFRRFVGLASDEGSPDRTVISRFRRNLRLRALERPFLDEVARQLRVQGLVVKRGLLIDARLAPAPTSRAATVEVSAAA